MVLAVAVAGKLRYAAAAAGCKLYIAVASIPSTVHNESASRLIFSLPF
jgi:hypothetical protein